MEKTHEPVLVDEVIKVIFDNALLNNDSEILIIDATVGLGGHSQEFVKRGAFVLGIDTDQEALKIAERRLNKACPAPVFDRRCFSLIHGNFIRIDSLARHEKVENVDAIIFDLGVNSPQLVSHNRGFSFREKKAVLDMRLDPKGQGVMAADLLNSLRGDQLIELFSVTCTYPEAAKLARSVVEFRKVRPFRLVGDFLEIIPRSVITGKMHPATKVFLAIRIATNNELVDLKEALPKAFDLIKKGGKLLVISFHSGEDRIVKSFFKDLENSKRAQVSKKPVLPTRAEIQRNPRARSAKLRYARKI